MIRRTSKRPLRRSLATLIAVIGALALSSGIAVLAASPADAAAEKWFVCKYKNTPGEPESLQSGQNPISVATAAILASLPKAEKDTAVIVPGFSFADGQGRSVVLIEDTGQEEPDVSECAAPREDTVIAVDVVFVDPTCDTEPSYSVTGDVDSVEISAPGAPVADGSTFTVTATALEGFMFAGGGDTYSESATFTAPDCTVVEPPIDVVDPPEETPEVTPTVVSAGVVPTAAGELSNGRGLGLVAGGLALLLTAGGIARPRKARL